MRDIAEKIQQLADLANFMKDKADHLWHLACKYRMEDSKYSAQYNILCNQAMRISIDAEIIMEECEEIRLRYLQQTLTGA